MISSYKPKFSPTVIRSAQRYAELASNVPPSEQAAFLAKESGNIVTATLNNQHWKQFITIESTSAENPEKFSGTYLSCPDLGKITDENPYCHQSGWWHEHVKKFRNSSHLVLTGAKEPPSSFQILNPPPNFCDLGLLSVYHSNEASILYARVEAIQQLKVLIHSDIKNPPKDQGDSTLINLTYWEKIPKADWGGYGKSGPDSEARHALVITEASRDLIKSFKQDTFVRAVFEGRNLTSDEVFQLEPFHAQPTEAKPAA